MKIIIDETTNDLYILRLRDIINYMIPYSKSNAEVIEIVVSYKMTSDETICKIINGQVEFSKFAKSDSDLYDLVHSYN